MHLTRWRAGLAALVFLSAAPAWGETRPLARNGSWEAFGGTASNGLGVCGVSANENGRYFGVKLFARDSTFTIQMGTKPWQVTNGEKVGLTMQFDANPPWQATAIGMHFNDGDGGLQLSVNRTQLDRFAQEFRMSSLLRIQFAANRFAEWLMALEGTLAVNSAFQNCARTLR